MRTQHPLLEWFISVGVKVHPDLYLEQDPLTGLSFYTAQPLARDTTIIQVPKKLCITSSSALSRIQLILQTLTGHEISLDSGSLPAPDWILLYLVLSRLAEEYLATSSDGSDELTQTFAHLPYVSHIPKVIETPLHFSPEEMSLLANTPLVASTERRLAETIVDYERARSLVSSQLTDLPGMQSHRFVKFLLEKLEPIGSQQLEDDTLMEYTYHMALELWRWAESAFTSRSFPPRLIGLSDHRDSSSSSSPDIAATSAPILIPAYDTFNHARAHPVTWSFSPATCSNSQPASDSEDMVCMTINYPLPAAPCQVYNNYGGKSNEEFLSSYGFTLDTVTEDTLALKLGGSGGVSGDGTQQVEAKTHYWIIPSESTCTTATREETAAMVDGFQRSPCPCPSLLVEMETRLLQADPDPDSDPSAPSSEEERVYLYANVLETLEALLLSKRKAFKQSQLLIQPLIEHFFPSSDNNAGNDDVPTREQRKNRVDGWHRHLPSLELDPKAYISPEVLRNIVQYRAGQLALVNHVVHWTRNQLATVADFLHQFEPHDDDEQSD